MLIRPGPTMSPHLAHRALIIRDSHCLNNQPASFLIHSSSNQPTLLLDMPFSECGYRAIASGSLHKGMGLLSGATDTDMLPHATLVHTRRWHSKERDSLAIHHLPLPLICSHPASVLTYHHPPEGVFLRVWGRRAHFMKPPLLEST